MNRVEGRESAGLFHSAHRYLLSEAALEVLSGVEASPPSVPNCPHVLSELAHGNHTQRLSQRLSITEHIVLVKYHIFLNLSSTFPGCPDSEPR